MDSKLFRKESLERFSSPEALHDYLRITSPQLWMVLTAVLCLAAGFVLYASSATMEETLPVQITVDLFEEEGDTWSLVTAELPKGNKGMVKTGMPVRFSGLTGRVETVYETEDVLGLLIKTEKNPIGLPEGTYEGVIVTEKNTPIGFLLN